MQWNAPSVPQKQNILVVLTKEGIKPQPKPVEAILMLTPPQNIKPLRRFLGMVQYYRDLWVRRSEMPSPLTDLVGECGHTKATRATKTKHKLWNWDDVHQTSSDNIKTAIAKDGVLAYPDYSQGFEIYNDSSKFQLGAVITQNNRPLTFLAANWIQHSKNAAWPNKNYWP